MEIQQSEGLDFEAYRKLVEAIPFGKRLPNAVYVHVDGVGELPPDVIGFLIALQSKIDAEGEPFNVIKFHTDEFKVSLLKYPDFMTNPHPALETSTVVDLKSFNTIRRSYKDGSNRPILHRKETFLRPSHDRYKEFRELTMEEERLGLLENRTRIGFEKQWSGVLERHGVTYDGHSIILKGRDGDAARPDDQNDHPKRVRRSKTALSRFGFSRPVQLLLKYDCVNSGRSFFDYGCGLGDDVRALDKLGFDAMGWDPVHSPEAEKKTADVVNLGFVVNVIEEPTERVEVLKEAYSLANYLLVVAVQIGKGNEPKTGRPFRDGVLTARGTFQVFYEHEEFGRVLEEVLDVPAISVGPGVYFLFKDPVDSQAFLERKSSRSIDFKRLRDELFGSKPRKAPESHLGGRRRSFYENNQEILDDYWGHMTRLGRPPGPDRYPRFNELDELRLTPQKAKNLFIKLFGKEALDAGFVDSNRELIEGFWDRLVEYGRMPSRDEYDRFDEMEAARITPDQLRNLYLRVHGQGSLEKAFRDRHADLVNEFWQVMVRLGRIPGPSEITNHADLRRLNLRPETMQEWFFADFGQEVFDEAVCRRKDDLLVYLALANFRRRIPFKHLPAQLKADLKTFFAGYKRALEIGREALFYLGNPGAVASLCAEVPFGWQDDHSLYIHHSLIADLPAGLRILLGCAEFLAGDIAVADLIKIHKQSSKVTLLLFQDFDRRWFPLLVERIKINLADQSVQYFDHSADFRPQVLCNKYRYVSSSHPNQETWRRLYRRVERIVGPIDCLQLPLEELQQRFSVAGFDMRLRRVSTNRG